VRYTRNEKYEIMYLKTVKTTPKQQNRLIILKDIPLISSVE